MKVEGVEYKEPTGVDGGRYRVRNLRGLVMKMDDHDSIRSRR